MLSGIENSASLERPMMILALIVCGALSLIWFGADYSVDGLNYATQVETGRQLWHPNHILPNYIWWGLQQTLQAFGMTPRAVVTIQFFNIVFGLAGCAVLFTVLRRFASVLNSTLLILLVYFSFAWWGYTQEPEVYIPALALICLQLPLLFDQQPPGWKGICLLVILCSAAIGFHQQHVIWYFVALTLLVHRLGDWGDRRVWVFALAVPILVLALYVALGLRHSAFDSLQSAAEWFLGFAWSQEGGISTYRVAAAPLHRLALAIAAVGNLFLPWTLIIQPTMVIVAAVTAVSSIAGTIVFAGWRQRRGRSRESRFMVKLLWAWLLAYFAFAVLWEARNVEFMVPLLIPLSLLSAVLLGNYRSPVLLVSITLVVMINVFLSHIPDSKIPYRYQLVLALDDAVNLRPADALITEERNTVMYLNYIRDKSVRYIPGAVSHLTHVNIPREQFMSRLNQRMDLSDRVFTLELATRGRLYWLARRLPWVSETDRGTIDSMEQQIYGTLTLLPVDGIEADVWQVKR